MAGKDFKSKMKADPKKPTEAKVDPVQVDPVQTTEVPVQATEEAPKKRSAGRPKTKTEDCKTINVAIPVSLLEKMNVAKVMYKDNLTLYVNKLIEKDIEANYERYEQFAEMQQSMM